MATKAFPVKDLIESLDNTTDGFLELIFSIQEDMMNNIPFTDSWTVAQVASHVTKSNKAIVQALSMDGKKAERNPGERIEELKKMFLNYETKFQSPEFIKPTQNIYKKETVVSDLEKSIGQLMETIPQINLPEIISLPAFGEITKLELLHFVLYHTQRHTHQLKNILEKLKLN